MSSRRKASKEELIMGRVQELCDGQYDERGVPRGIAEKRVKARQSKEFDRRVQAEYEQLVEDAEQSIREDMASGSSSRSNSSSSSASGSASA
jgi:hypothetical protein